MGVIGYLDVSEDKYNIENSPILFIIPSGYIEDIESLKKYMKIKASNNTICIIRYLIFLIMYAP